MASHSVNVEVEVEASGEQDGPPPLMCSSLSRSQSSSTSTASLQSDQPAEKVSSTPLKNLAVYPNGRAINNRNPYAQSAKRRNSLQSLRSIAHLQHMYTRQGLASKSKPDVLGRAHPALGSEVIEPDTIYEGMLPKTPLAPSHFEYGEHLIHCNYSKSPDRHDLRRDALAAWTACSQMWALSELLDKGMMESDDDFYKDQQVDLFEILFTTRKTIRCVRNYLLSIPQEQVDGETINDRATTCANRLKPSFRRQSSFFCSPRREIGYGVTEGHLLKVDNSLNKQRSESNLRSGGDAQVTSTLYSKSTSRSNFNALIRNAALEVLSQLKDLEAEKCHIERDTSALLEVSLSDLSLGSANDYSEHTGLQIGVVLLKDLDKERACIRQYLQLVQATFDDIKKSEVEEDEEKRAPGKVHLTPSWSHYEAKDGLAGALEILHYFVHSWMDTHHFLTDSNENRRQVMEALSDGVLLCQAFNKAILASSKPWGLINASDINVVEGSWTFLKRQNLTVWTAALKSRYNISISGFDAILVAKGGPLEGWMDMLQTLICNWAYAVAKEHNNIDVN